VNLEWSAFAQDDRNGIFDYIELHDPRAAATIDNCVFHVIVTGDFTKA